MALRVQGRRLLPVHDAAPVAGLVCFYTERTDLGLDGVAVERPVTPWV